MRKPETTFYTGVNRYIPREVYRLKNNNEYVAGIPDFWYSGNKADLWVEYKYKPIEKPRTQVIPDLSKQQLRWIQTRKTEGRNVWVIVGYQNGGVIYREIDEMEIGLSPDEFLRRTLSRKDLARTIENFCV